MAAAWNRRPGVGPAHASGLVQNHSSDVYAGVLKALRDLSDSIPGFAARLQTKEQLDAKQRTLVQSRGSVEQIGMSTEQVQLRVSERVGKGTFCVVFRGEMLSGTLAEAEGKAVAAKFELRKNDATQLRNEFRIYKKLDKCDGIPRIYTFGEMDFHKVLVMDLLGPSLESLFQDCNRRFSIKTTAMLALQMITRIETLHKHDLIYRDIKPENFLMGLPGTDTANQVFLIDYGMAKTYRDPDTSQHIPFGDAQSLSGTARYMSINAHCRRNQSRRDDLEALGHVFMYFVRGNLPWQSAKTPLNDTRYDLMCEKKQATTVDDLCRGFPPEMAQYLTYTRDLTFEQDPDYDYLRGLFTKVLDGEGAGSDGIFDWIKPKTEAEDEATVGKAEPITAPVTTAPAALQQQVAAKPAIVAQPAEETDDTTPRPSTPSQPVSGTGGAEHRVLVAVQPPASPPGGKRRRSEFASDLQPPGRSIRAKKATYAFYDSEAQRILATLHRDVMAGRYTFHRAVKQSQSGIGGNAAAAAAAALSARGIGAAGMYNRSMGQLRGIGSGGGGGAAVIAPAFTELLDKTLAQVIGELEDMSDKLLQDGDWTGAARVHGWFEQVTALIKEETDRLEAEQEKKRQTQKEVADAAAAGTETETETETKKTASGLGESISPAPALQTKLGGLPSSQHQSSQQISAFISADPLEVDDGADDDNDNDDDEPLDEASLRARYSTRPGLSSSSSLPRRMLGSPRVPTTLVASVPTPTPAASAKPYPGAGAPMSAPVSTKPYALGSASAAVRSGMGFLIQQAEDTILAADGDDDDSNADDGDDKYRTKTANQGSDDKIDADDSNDGNEILELVYRTASGTRRVVRVADQDQKGDGQGGRP
ncbi:hypothetical protein SCUCBS95973_003101 [Sporothrix curviconia]|uniref:non-specific serine/threonine protein kinase n=1 Tax=Sporothrix curviconia TaxID=1260050 RepID=A0ABP0BCE2_9PEZI